MGREATTQRSAAAKALKHELAKARAEQKRLAKAVVLVDRSDA